MASIVRQPNGRKAIQFTGIDGRRQTIRLGKMSDRDAGRAKDKIEAVLSARAVNGPLDKATAEWLRGLKPELADKLARAGLVEPQRRATLAEFLAEYVEGRRGELKPLAVVNLNRAAALLKEHFGADCPLASVTPDRAEGFAAGLRARYARATAGRRIKYAKQYFAEAARRGLLDANPFANVKGGDAANEARKRFIPRDVVAKVLDACPDAEWRLIVALGRYGGLRTPSETLRLTWDRIDWAKGRFYVPSTKTEHHHGKAGRWVPIFPELRPFLKESFDLAAEGTVYVVTRTRDAGVNLRTQMLRILDRAGVEPWPRLFHNLRASRETELAGEYPLHVAAEWIGNSAVVAARHYLTVREEDYARAVEGPQGALQKALQNATQSGADGGCPGMTAESENPSFVAEVASCRSQSNAYKCVDYARQDSNL